MKIEQIVMERTTSTIDEGTMGFHDYVEKKESIQNFVDRVSDYATRLQTVYGYKIINISYISEDLAVISYKIVDCENDSIINEIKQLPQYHLNLADAMIDMQRSGSSDRHYVCLEDVLSLISRR